MGSDSRLNILLTHADRGGRMHSGAARSADEQPWYQMVSHLLLPLGVRTFEATSGPAAMELIEHEPIHLAVVDTKLGENEGLNLLRLIQKLRQRAAGIPEPPQKPGHRVEVKFGGSPAAQRVEVRFEGQTQPNPPAASPVVILVTSPRDDQVFLKAALKFDAFSVMNEPVDVNLLLEMMARALRRFHQNQWPQ